MRFCGNISEQKLCGVDKESTEELQRSTKLRMGVNVDHIRVTRLDDRIGSDDDQSPSVCFSYGTASKSLQKTDHKQAQSEHHGCKDDYFSGAKSKMICPQIKFERETQMDTQSHKQEKNLADASSRINLSYTNNIFEVGTSTMLVDSGHRPTGVFAGDRFIPCRPEETHLEGV